MDRQSDPSSLVTAAVGRRRIIALPGRAGMAIFYRATDLTLRQSVALKFLPAETG